ncbi:stage III sporulation protein AF [Xylanibacillus composti]|uniref:Stage III sporulation protein AF n=1 Tax=Xylanibacillus composti TaxID=1572762 RepID=A0A8J4H870_9BACL|nr:stage III sporulation protein AF [Xylanibacillus composti]MDT9726283.1 stage III sporulation protein AF [Xylanibacillus composti]GIQ70688.1 hypothetical protein XYCOK13_35120 [Xylanibacillus composti]
MIAWLSEWLKEIVVIVLLAVFVDLVLPNRSMQRYVKVVLSLLILLAILSPLVELLRSGEQWDVWLQPGAGERIGQPLAGAGEMASLAAISREAEQMTAERNRQALELAQLRLESAVARTLEESLAIRKADVSAELRPGANPEEVLLKGMAIRLWLRPDAEEAAAAAVRQDSSKPAAIAPIEPVAPVVVAIREEPSAWASVKPGEPQPAAEDVAADTQAIDNEALQQAALALVEEQYDIPRDKVRISVDARR